MDADKNKDGHKITKTQKKMCFLGLFVSIAFSSLRLSAFTRG